MSLNARTLTDSILPGRGLLASMISWVTGRSAETLTEDVGSPERFDPQRFMQGLIAYERRHRRRLRGVGLVLGLTDELLPPSMQAVARQQRELGATDAVSFRAADYLGDGYQRAMERAWGSSAWHSEWSLERAAPRQLSHLANAVCVRAALRMATFALGSPAIALRDDGGVNVEFVPPADSGLPQQVITVDRDSNAMGVGRCVKTALDASCRAAFDQALGDVSAEFDAAVRLGLSKAVADLVGILPFLRGLPALVRMSHSSQSFSNLSAVYAENTRFVASLSRPAISDALRHSRRGWSLGAYRAHVDPQLAAETAAARSLGALAFSTYSLRTLKLLWGAHGRDSGQSLIAITAGPGGVYRTGPTSRDPSDVSHSLMDAFAQHVSPLARSRLAQLSPQYLAPLVIGGAQHPLGQNPAFGSDEAANAAAGQRAGRRLAWAVNDAADPALGLNGLPWAGVLASDQCAQLLLSEEPDERLVREGLRSLIAFANAQRTKGETVERTVPRLPDIEALLAAPPHARVASLERLQGPLAGNAWRSAHRSAIRLVDDLVAASGPICSNAAKGVGGLRGTVEWRAALVGFGNWAPPGDVDDIPFGEPESPGTFPLRSSLVIALRDSKTGKHWQRVTLGACLMPAIEGLDEHPRLTVDAGFSDSFTHLPVVDGPASPKHERQNLHSLHGTEIASPHSAPRKFPAPTKTAQQEHHKELRAVWQERLTVLIRTHPAEMAALLPAVAAFILTGQDSPQRPVERLGSARGLSLARVSMALDNAWGFELIATRMRDPRATMANGASLLDIALESSSAEFAQLGLAALAKHPVFAKDPAALRQMVQDSLGKLVERHHWLLPAALGLGATLDSATLAAWEALHPHLKTPEVQAAVTAARMREAIAAAKPQVAAAAANDSPIAPVRRRAGL